MYIIPLKPLSVNKAYRGRRFATKELQQYKKDLFRLLPKLKVGKGKLGVSYVFGLSSKGADGDNLIKSFQDCLTEAYNFNDNKIYEWKISKDDVKKGNEYISFEIYDYPSF